MAVNIANPSFDLEELKRQLLGGNYTPSNPNPVPDPSTDITGYDPYRTPSTSPTGGTSTVVDWSTRNTNKENGGGVDETGTQSGSGAYDPSTSGPNAPQTTKTPKDCGPGYEWEDGGPNFPNGRCKIIGMTWEESQGKVAPGWYDAHPEDRPENRQSGASGNAYGSAKAPAPAAAPKNAFDLQALMAMLGPQYQAILAKIASGTNPYDPATVEALVGNNKVAAERMKLDQQNMLQAQRSATGRGTQGATQQDLRSIAANADIASSSAINQIRENAIKANYAAEIQRIDQQIQTVNSYANMVLGLASSDSQRQSTQLQYAAQINSLQAQRANLELQLQAELDKYKLGLLFGAN